MRVETAVPPGESVTLDGLTLQPGHDTQRGGGEVVRLTLPRKPLILVRIMSDFPADPCTIVSIFGLADIAKSGDVPDETTLKATLTEWERPPLFPYTVMLPAAPSPPAKTVRVAVPVELGATATLDGLISQVVH